MSRPRPARTARAARPLLASPCCSPRGSPPAAGGGDDGGRRGRRRRRQCRHGRLRRHRQRPHLQPGAGPGVPARGVTPAGRSSSSGRHVGFAIDPTTLGVYDYTLTGAPDPQRMVTAPTVVFASKVPMLTAAQLRRRADRAAPAARRHARGHFSHRRPASSRCRPRTPPRAGSSRWSRSSAAPVEYVHTLGAGLFYFVNEFTGKINFGNGVAADATHQMLLGKDSPQVATKLAQTATTTRWSVASGRADGRRPRRGRDRAVRRRHQLHHRLPGPQPHPGLGARAAGPDRARRRSADRSHPPDGSGPDDVRAPPVRTGADDDRHRRGPSAYYIRAVTTASPLARPLGAPERPCRRRAPAGWSTGTAGSPPTCGSR